ncbi:ilvD [Gossypium arboreum]|uniref:IlvD n=1 Tax=Gossypium arboreum TaxID=29729 RepID=A0A0B0NSU4_GOSAR|nr:ilvD [Gossypium arboreum]
MALVLRVACNRLGNCKISFMSDKQKGLVEAICILFPNAKTRYCVRHLYANFKKAGFRTKELKDLLWKAARESTTKEFEDAIDELRKTNQHTYDWLKEKNLTHWSRSHFSIRGHSDMLVSNLSESFNKMILEARGKPILTMMEIIRIKIMLLIVKKK